MWIGRGWPYGRKYVHTAANMWEPRWRLVWFNICRVSNRLAVHRRSSFLPPTFSFFFLFIIHTHVLPSLLLVGFPAMYVYARLPLPCLSHILDLQRSEPRASPGRCASGFPRWEGRKRNSKRAATRGGCLQASLRLAVGIHPAATNPTFLYRCDTRRSCCCCGKCKRVLAV